MEGGHLGEMYLEEGWFRESYVRGGESRGIIMGVEPSEAPHMPLPLRFLKTHQTGEGAFQSKG